MLPYILSSLADMIDKSLENSRSRATMSGDDPNLHIQATVELPRDSTSQQNDEPARAKREEQKRDSTRKPAMAFVEGSQASLRSEANELLRVRIRAASLALFALYLTFFVLSLFRIGRFDGLETTLEWTFFWAHFGITVITGLVGFRLCADCHIIRGMLRFTEMMIFGGSALFFAILSYSAVIDSVANGYIIPISGPWILLIFTYALFVPNTWQRASAVIIPMALIPVCILVSIRMTSMEFRDVIRMEPEVRGIIVTSALVMIFGAMIAIWGVSMLGTLRRKVMEAKRLGQYKLKKLLGRGGMGEVHLAEHVLLKRPCALKLIRPEMAGDPNTLSRFEREVKSTAQLTHWNTVEIYDYGRAEDGTFYYVMEYLPGMNLDQLVEMHGPMTPGRVVFLLQQVCEALAEAHDKGLIHRDIKPGNIFSAHRGGRFDVVKLLDFGLVRTLLADQDASLTAEGVIMGSPMFLSPEQAQGDEPVVQSDIYSLGAVAYFLLTARAPFEFDNVMKVILAHATQMPEKPSSLSSDIPEELSDIIMRCLAKKPADRYASAEQLRAALEACGDIDAWDQHKANQWWTCHGCPEKKRQDREILEVAHSH
jgi:hypothetical protein